MNESLDALVEERTSNLLDGLVSALDLRDSETQWHSRRVGRYARRLAEELRRSRPRAGRHRAGRDAARHRQDRRARRRAAQTRSAGRRRMGGDEAAPRRSATRSCKGIGFLARARADPPAPPGTLGRHRLSPGAGGQATSASAPASSRWSTPTTRSPTTARTASAAPTRRRAQRSSSAPPRSSIPRSCRPGCASPRPSGTRSGERPRGNEARPRPEPGQVRSVGSPPRARPRCAALVQHDRTAPRAAAGDETRSRVSSVRTGIARWLASSTSSTNSEPNRIRSANSGALRTAGRPSTSPSARANSALVTGSGATELSGPDTASCDITWRIETDLDPRGESRAATACRCRAGPPRPMRNGGRIFLIMPAPLRQHHAAAEHDDAQAHAPRRAALPPPSRGPGPPGTRSRAWHFP